MTAPTLAERAVEWLGDLNDWNGSHNYGACGCTNVADHARRYHALMDRKKALLAEMTEVGP